MPEKSGLSQIRLGMAEWTREGYCQATQQGPSDCINGRSGSWEISTALAALLTLTPSQLDIQPRLLNGSIPYENAAAACTALCAACARCFFVSLSVCAMPTTCPCTPQVTCVPSLSESAACRAGLPTTAAGTAIALGCLRLVGASCLQLGP